MSIVEFHDVTKAFGDKEVLHNITLGIDKGDVVVICGPSGSGKSTLLRCINALEKITSGDVIVDGLSVNGGQRDIRRVRLEAGMVFQQFNLFPHMTALQNVAFGPRKARGQSRAKAGEIARGLLHKVGLSSHIEKFPNELSGGQQQRVAIARALAVKPRLMLFDEPTSALDPELRYEVLQVMRDLANEGMTMIVVTHEMSFAHDVGKRLLFMDEGRIREDGPAQTLLVDPPSKRLRDFLQHVR